jgi:S1-C subfamily serine protease
VASGGLPWTGDIILAVGEEPVRNTGQLKRVLANLKPGSKVLVSVTVGPGALRRSVRMTLSPPPGKATPAAELTPTSRP